MPERHLSGLAHRFESAALYDRDFAVGLLWASEAPSAEQAALQVTLTLARAAWERTRGPARTLREKLAQEHEALRFAGLAPKPLPPAQFLAAADAPTLFACLYGDDAARALGYGALGVPEAL